MKEPNQRQLVISELAERVNALEARVGIMEHLNELEKRVTALEKKKGKTRAPLILNLDLLNQKERFPMAEEQGTEPR